MKYTWVNDGNGYECSSRGDSRFSALFAILEDGRTIEQHYQCDVKQFDPGGTNWRLGKGKPPLDKNIQLWDAYLGLWERWAEMNPELILELAQLAKPYNNILSDQFAGGPVNQAHALATILNRLDTETFDY